MILPDPARLLAVSAIVDPPTIPEGLLGLAGTDGYLFAADRRTLVGMGTVATLSLPRGLDDPSGLAAAQRWLAAVPLTRSAGGPSDRSVGRVTALGALPFDRDAPGSLLVPELLVGRDEAGSAWAVLVTADRDRPPADLLADALRHLFDRARARARAVGNRATAGGLAGSGAAGSDGVTAGPDLPTLTELPPGEQYASAVASAVDDIRAGRLDKVVLARGMDARFADPVDLAPVIDRLRSQEPSCTTFSLPVDHGRFVGASPELLVRRDDGSVACHPLAGTVGLIGRADRDAEVVDRFLASAKDHSEHQLVVDEIARDLAAYCDDLEVPAEPSLVRLRSVAHLGTTIRGTLRTSPDGRPSVLALLAALHPTPAVGGVPRQAALAAIGALETVPRDHWAGPVGWVDAEGDGEWMIGLRSATVTDRLVRLNAGAGIVAGSDPAAELAETTVKLAPVLDALAPGASTLL